MRESSFRLQHCDSRSDLKIIAARALSTAGPWFYWTRPVLGGLCLGQGTSLCYHAMLHLTIPTSRLDHCLPCYRPSMRAPCRSSLHQLQPPRFLRPRSTPASVPLGQSPPSRPPTPAIPLHPSELSAPLGRAAFSYEPLYKTLSGSPVILPILGQQKLHMVSFVELGPRAWIVFHWVRSVIVLSIWRRC